MHIFISAFTILLARHLTANSSHQNATKDFAVFGGSLFPRARFLISDGLLASTPQDSQSA